MILVIQMLLCDKGIAIRQANFGFFQAIEQSVGFFPGLFLALFGFSLKFSSGNPGFIMCKSVAP